VPEALIAVQQICLHPTSVQGHKPPIALEMAAFRFASVSENYAHIWSPCDRRAGLSHCPIASKTRVIAGCVLFFTLIQSFERPLL
jgi:hypothetical protein